LCFFAHIIWWNTLSIGAPRHLIPAFIYYFAGLSLLLTTIDYKNLSYFQNTTIFLFVFFLLASRDEESNYLFSNSFPDNNKELQEQLTVTQTVKNLQQQGVTLISCGNNFELEYLLPNSGNFKNCEETLQKSPNSPTLLVSYFYNKQVLFLEHDGDGGVMKDIPKAIAKKCNREYLRTKNYSLNWCQGKNLQIQ
jgi:hypothetical protein